MKWIDINNRVPNSGIEDYDTWSEQVIITVLSLKGYNHVSTGRMKGQDWYWNENNKKISDNFKVTHWMRLPNH